jgi:ABC-type branched-subunit amino acid transport system substrate-binding protein
VLEVAYTTSDEVSMLEAAQRLESSGAEAVLIPDTVEVTTRMLNSLSPEFRKRIRVLGTSAWDSPDKIAHSQALFNGAIFVAPFFKNSTRREVQDFIASYRGKFNAAPTVHSAQGFDAETLLNNALKVSRAKGVPLPEAIQSLPQYDGVTGVITSGGGSGEIQRALYVVEVGPSSFQEKLPPQQVQRFEELYTATQDQVTGIGAVDGSLEADQKVSSGY